MRAPLQYPCPWTYKIIGRDLTRLQAAVGEAMAERPYTSVRRPSRGGSFHCLTVTLLVESEAVRLSLYEKLRKNDAVMIVL